MAADYFGFAVNNARQEFGRARPMPKFVVEVVERLCTIRRGIIEAPDEATARATAEAQKDEWPTWPTTYDDADAYIEAVRELPTVRSGR